jgi:hypothetical protein
MENENIKIIVDKDTKELIIREGSATEPKADVKIAVNGNINSVIEWIKKRKAQGAAVDEKDAYIVVNEEKGFIILFADDKDEFGTVITGQIFMHPQLEAFKINVNNDKGFDLKNLIKHLKFRKHLFADKAVHTKLINDLMGFTTKITTEISAQNDLKGNKVESLVSNALIKLDLDFYLDTELFSGFNKHKFKVDINFDVRGQNDIVFWFESVDLSTLIEEEKRLILHDKQTEFSEFVIINQ